MKFTVHQVQGIFLIKKHRLNIFEENPLLKHNHIFFNSQTF